MASHLNWVLFSLAFLYFQKKVVARSSQLERIINGAVAAPKQFPYQVFYDTAVCANGKWWPSCGGTIISDGIILTAAHCTDWKFCLARIHFGTVNKSNTSEIGQVQMIVQRSNFVVHRNWKPRKLINDIALIKLPKKLEFNEYIQPAKLPESNNLYVNQKAIISGWGLIKVHNNGVGIMTHVLQYYATSILSNQVCSLYKNNGFPANFKFDLTGVCSAPGRSSACSGDSGGPLAIRNNDNSSILVGITSFVWNKYCTPTTPVYFTRVSSYLDWISINAGAENLPSTPNVV